MFSDDIEKDSFMKCVNVVDFFLTGILERSIA